MASLLDTLRSNGIDDPLARGLVDQLDALGVEDVTTQTTGDVTVVRATVRSLADRGLPELGTLPVQAPGLSSGLRAQVAVRHPGGTVAEWAVDLDLDPVTLLVPGVRPARESREPARASRLVDDPGRSQVRIVGRGVLRIAAAAGTSPQVSLIDRLDENDPFGPKGPVVTMDFEPASFFLGSSTFGLTVHEITYDQSPNVSPPPQAPDWRGIALKRATLFLPPGAPLLGDVSLGVEDVFLGDPAGVQGIAALEFGGAADTPLALVVEQETAPGTWTPLAVSTLSDPAMRADALSAALQGSHPPPARVRARLTTPPVGAVRWTLPRGATDPDGFDVLPGDVLSVRVDEGAPTTCAFTGTWAGAPTVDAALGALSWANVTSVRGRSADLAAVVFRRSAGPGTFAWRWDGGAEDSADTTSLPAGADVGSHVLELRQSGFTVRRIRVDVSSPGTPPGGPAPVLVGSRTGVFSAAGGVSTPVAVLDVVGTYALGAWYLDGRLSRSEPAATVSGGSVTVPQGELAEVVTDAVDPGSTAPPAPGTDPVETRAHVRFVYDSDELSPATSFWLGDRTRTLDRLAAWVSSLGAGAKFAVVGRCDDLSAKVPITATSDTYNRDLAVDRAKAGRDLLRDAGVPESAIALRGEQSGWIGAPPTGALPPEASAVSWVARSTTDYQSWDRPYPRDDDHRKPLRRCDIYAYDVTPTASAEPPAQDGNTLDPVRLRALVPGDDPTTVSGAPVPSVPRGRPQYRVRIEVEWNDPAARGLGDAVPIRAEAIVQWPGTAVRLPGNRTAELTRPDDAPPGTPPVWTLRGRWAHDAAAGSDDFTLSIDVTGTPTGIAQITDRTLAASLGLAPAVVGAADNPHGGDAALVGALIAALGAAAGTLLRDGSKTVVTGITIDHLERGPSGSGSRTRLTVDYTVSLSVDVAGAGLPLHVSTRPDKPMKLRYKGVGVEVDTAAADWWDGVGLVVNQSVPEVVDPGSWQLGAPLDDLLRVTGARSGAQSSWLEVDLALSLDLGVVTLSNATVRVVFGPSGIQGVELRGLRAGVNIPATLVGEGALDVSDHVIHAGLQVDLIPLKIGVLADLAMGDQGHVELTVGVRFPAPIPFANSGLGLFGVIGRFVSNGRRAVDAGNPDPVERELGWLAKPYPKYTPQAGQYALGLGAVIGTAPDLGFTFHALGMLTVEFPRPAVILGVIADIMRETAPVPSDVVPRPGYGLSIIGLVVIDEHAVTIALRGHYEIPGVLVLDVPVAAWFPYSPPTDFFVHVGTDGQPGRAGAPVTLTLLPDVLDVRVWAFVLVHGNGLSPGLQGNADFVFGGFAVGFGAGWEIDWSAGPIRLTASATVLAGFGTDPLFLAAGIWVRGELDLVVLSVSARGELTLKTDGHRTDLHGEFCGEVDCFFFSISGCVSIDVTATLGPTPTPKSPVAGADLVARRGHATDKAARPGEQVPVVWTDTVPVIHFAHTVAVGVSAGDFAVGQPMPGPVWSGSRDVQYAFRLTGVRLEPQSGPPLSPPAGTQFDSVWWWPGVRDPAKPPWLSASGSEPRDLALLSWQPWTGLLPLTEPDGSPGDPGPVVGDVCDPVRTVETVCVTGESGRPAGAGQALLSQDPADPPGPDGPQRLRLRQPGDAPWVDLVAAAASAGVVADPGHLAPLDHPVALATGPTRGTGWRLAGLVRGGQQLGSLPAVGAYEGPLHEPSLVLEVCRVPVVEKERPEDIGTGDCVDFADVDPDTLRGLARRHGTELERDGVVVRDLADRPLQAVDFDGDGRWALLLVSTGLRVELPDAVDEVTVRVVSGQEWKVLAFDPTGAEVASDGAIGDGSLTLSAAGIVALEVFGEGEGGLAQVCAGSDDPLSDLSGLLSWAPGREAGAPPAVVGLLPSGEEVAWKASVERGRRCSTVRYDAPMPGPWVGFRVPAVPGRSVTVVGSCGVRWRDAVAVHQAELQRRGVQAGLLAHATGAPGQVRATATATGAGGLSGLVNLPLEAVLGAPERTLLRPDTEYRLTVSWQWQGWERSDSSPQPGPPADGAWVDGTDEVFVFRTAALASLPAPPPPVDLIGEGRFDPRGVARYVTGGQPAGPLPHLLDDPIRVTFSVDYLPKLLDGYGFDTRVEVRPTDVDPGAVPPGTHPPDLVRDVRMTAWVEDGVLMPVERRVLEVLADVPCPLPPTSLGGTAVEVDAPLEPLKAYDLLLVAHPRAGGADVVVQRWHFRTSAYRDIDGLLDAVGLPVGRTTAVAPQDVLLDRQWPALPAAPFDDQALDTALSALGVEPWPLSPTPRTTTIWVPPDPGAGRGDWALAGVLLEAPEPIARSGRVAVTATAGAAALSVVRSTGSGTRVLLAPAMPVVVGPDDALSVTLTDGLRGRTRSGAAQLLGGPRTIRREQP